MVYIAVLRGGMTGTWLDGSWLSRGMNDLARQIKNKFGSSVIVQVFDWGQWRQAMAVMKARPITDKLVMIGYSGGGSRATWIANYAYPLVIDLIVAYDPSPMTAMLPLRKNVKRAICYWNRHPMMLDLGGGWIAGSHEVDVENQEITPSVQHLLVQNENSLHQKTIEAIGNLIGTAGTA